MKNLKNGGIRDILEAMVDEPSGGETGSAS